MIEPAVLIVGSHGPWRSALERSLKQYGSYVEVAEPDHVVDAALTAAPDLVVLLEDAARDCGVDILQQLESKGSVASIPVAIVDDGSGLDAKLRAYRSGAVAVIRRQASVDATAQEVASVSRGLAEARAERRQQAVQATLGELVEALQSQLGARLDPSGGGEDFQLVLGAGKPLSELIDDFVSRVGEQVIRAEPFKYERPDRFGTDASPTSNDAAAYDLSRLRLLLVDDDVSRADTLAQALRSRGVTVVVTDPNPKEGRFARLRQLDPAVVLIAAGVQRQEAISLIQRFSLDVRLRWPTVLFSTWGDADDPENLPDLPRILAELESVAETERFLRERASGDKAFYARLEAHGPARLIRALVDSGSNLRVSLKHPRLQVEVDLGDGLVVGARGAAKDDEMEASRALSAFLVVGSGRVHVEPITNHFAANIMSTPDVALAMADGEEAPIEPSEHVAGTSALLAAMSFAGSDSKPTASDRQVQNVEVPRAGKVPNMSPLQGSLKPPGLAKPPVAPAGPTAVDLDGAWSDEAPTAVSGTEVPDEARASVAPKPTRAVGLAMRPLAPRQPGGKSAIRSGPRPLIAKAPAPATPPAAPATPPAAPATPPAPPSTPPAAPATPPAAPATPLPAPVDVLPRPASVRPPPVAGTPPPPVAGTPPSPSGEALPVASFAPTPPLAPPPPVPPAPAVPSDVALVASPPPPDGVPPVAPPAVRDFLGDVDRWARTQPWIVQLTPAGLPPWQVVVTGAIVTSAMVGIMGILLIAIIVKQVLAAPPTAAASAAPSASTAPTPDPAPAPSEAPAASVSAGDGGESAVDVPEPAAAPSLPVDARVPAPTCTELVTTPPGAKSPAEAWFLSQAQKQLIRGRVDAAHELYCRALAAHPKSLNVLLALARIYLLRRDGKAAVEAARKAFEVGEQAREAENVLIDALALEGGYKEARRRIVVAAPGSSPDGLAAAHANEGRKALRKFRLMDAEKHFRRSLVLNPEAPVTAGGLAETMLKNKRGESALLWAEYGQKLQPRNSDLLLLVGDAHRLLGRDDAARKAYEAALDIEPRNPKAKRRLRIVAP